MVKVLIVYDSKTGNTEKMAQAIAKGANKIDSVTVELKKADETTNDDLVKADGIIIGSPTYYGLLSSKIKAMIDTSVKIHGQLEGKIGAAFTSSGGIASGAETTLLSIIQAMLVHGMLIKGRAKQQHYGLAVVQQPEEDELTLCEEFGADFAKICLKVK